MNQNELTKPQGVKAFIGKVVSLRIGEKVDADENYDIDDVVLKHIDESGITVMDPEQDQLWFPWRVVLEVLCKKQGENLQ